MVDRYHPRNVEMMRQLGISFDLFTETDTENHWAVTQEMFLEHLKNEVVYKDKMPQLYCVDCNKWLADRYVEGTCPHCGYTGARGDQCDNCGRTYDAIELINPRCKYCGGSNIEVRETEHFFLDLGALNDPLLEWVTSGAKTHWRPNVYNYTVSRLATHELHGRPITRDLTWGVTIPLPGYENKRIYVWYDAVIGYLSASKEWAGGRRPARGVARVVERQGRPHLLLHRQGQHRLPHHHLARHADRLRPRFEPALRRAGQRVPERRGPQALARAGAG